MIAKHSTKARALDPTPGDSATYLVCGRVGPRLQDHNTFRSITTVRRASGRPQGVSGPALLLENLPLASGLASRLTWSEVWA